MTIVDKLRVALSSRANAEDEIVDILLPFTQTINDFLGHTRYHKDELRVESVTVDNISFSVRNWDFDVVEVNVPISILEDDGKMDEIKRRRELAGLRSELNRLNTMSGVVSQHIDNLREEQAANAALIAKVTEAIARYESRTP